MDFFDTDNQDECKKTIQYYGCGGKGHLLHECKETSAKNKKNIFSLNKLDELKKEGGEPASSGAVNVAVKENTEELVEEEQEKNTYEDLLELYGFDNVSVEILLEDVGNNYVCEFDFAEAAEVGKWKDQGGRGSDSVKKTEPTRF